MVKAKTAKNGNGHAVAEAEPGDEASKGSRLDDALFPKDEKPQGETVVIKPLRIQVAEFLITGDAPYVQHAFSKKALEMMKAKQEAGETSKKNRSREPKDFDACYREAMHVSTEGWHGIPAAGFRAALISACRCAGFAMARAKLALFVLADGFDRVSRDGLVRITKGEPEPIENLVRIQMTTDIRVRPAWAPGWQAVVRVKFDRDQFTLTDVANLMNRVGQQVGIGEGRPDSRESAGMGWGTFTLALAEQPK